MTNFCIFILDFNVLKYCKYVLQYSIYVYRKQLIFLKDYASFMKESTIKPISLKKNFILTLYRENNLFGIGEQN